MNTNNNYPTFAKPFEKIVKTRKEFDDFHEHRTGKDRRKKRDQNFKKIREMKGWTLDEN